jgi:monoamine oxidase
MDMADNIIDVAIIGGGPAGVYAGWRLLTGEIGAKSSLRPATGDKLCVRLYEASDRIGGRLQSLTPPGAPNLRAEFGGMGYSTHNRITRPLVEDVLKLPTTNFPVGSAHNLNYLRGMRYPVADYASHPEKIPYRLSPDEQGKNFAQLILIAIQKIIPNVTALTSAEWRDIKQNFVFEGRHLYDMGFANLLTRLMSYEAYALAIEAGGQYSFVANWNAAEALEWYMAGFRADAVYKTIPMGYDHLPKTLHAQFMAAGGETVMNTSLRGISKDGEYFRLTFSQFDPILARHVILAMPRRSLELIAPNSMILGDIKPLIETVTPIPVMKIFLAYPTAWWQAQNITDGRSVTDLPIRVVYYIGAEQGDNTNALLMASYNDTRYTDFWRGFKNGVPFDNQPNPFITDIDPTWHAQRATGAMVDEVARQLALLHGIDNIPTPYSASYKDWSDDPYGGAWNSWKVGVKAWEVMPNILQPDPNESLFICGSAYSLWQGWVEGALQTAEQVVCEKLGMAHPAWLPVGE